MSKGKILPRQYFLGPPSLSENSNHGGRGRCNLPWNILLIQSLIENLLIKPNDNESINNITHLFFQVLYTYPENFRAYKALIAAQYSGTDVKVAPNFVFGETNKSEDFLKKFPAGKVSLNRRIVHSNISAYVECCDV